jgi:CubicO group peptidase (beta-lactamase class C family)
MLLVQRGVVSLDAPLARYLPNIPHAREITVRELLDQTTGLHEYLEDKQLYASLLDASLKAHPISYYVELGAKKPLQFKPGSKWAYSNTNYAILGMLDAKMSGKPYETYIRSSILVPQHLDDTEFMAFAPPAGTNVSEGYDYKKNQYVHSHQTRKISLLGTAPSSQATCSMPLGFAPRLRRRPASKCSPRRRTRAVISRAVMPSGGSLVRTKAVASSGTTAERSARAR